MMTERKPNYAQTSSAIIVGGSLAGLMAAIALACEGINVTIMEKASEDRPVGAGLQVDSGAFVQTKTEKLLRDLASGGKKSVQIWGAIESRLRTEAKARDNIKICYKTRIESVGQNKNIAWAKTEGGEVFYGDILIGADGHRSLVRRHVAPYKPDATFAGFVVWIAAMDEKDLPEDARPHSSSQKVTMLDGGMDGFLFGSILDRENESPTVSNRRIGCAWYDNSRNDLLRQLGCIEGTVVKHSLDGPDIPEATLHALMDQASVKWPEPWASVTVQALKARQVTGIPIKEYVPDKLVNGRIALVGDAAHVPAPITASGFNESLQDAVALGKVVSKGPKGKEIIEVLKKYESNRLNKVREIVQSGMWFSQSFGQP